MVFLCVDIRYQDEMEKAKKSEEEIQKLYMELIQDFIETIIESLKMLKEQGIEDDESICMIIASLSETTGTLMNFFIKESGSDMIEDYVWGIIEKELKK